MEYAPDWVSVEIKGRTAELDWRDSNDRDGDLAGYRVYVSPKPRGWNYGAFTGPGPVKPYWAGPAEGFRDYAAWFREPPGKIITVRDSRVSVALGASPVYLTVMPFDAHGERVGRRIYRASEELRLPAVP